MDRTKVIGIVAAVVGVVVVVAALKIVGSGGDGEQDEAAEAAEASRDGVSGAASGGQGVVRGGAAAGDPGTVEQPVAQRGSGFVPSGGARGVEGSAADFGGDLTILPPQYDADPLPALEERVREAAASIPDGRVITITSFGCLTGGADCRVSGTAQVPTDVRRMAEQIEQAATEGDDEAPTVEIDETRGSSSGSTDFVMGVYY